MTGGGDVGPVDEGESDQPGAGGGGDSPVDDNSDGPSSDGGDTSGAQDEETQGCGRRRRGGTGEVVVQEPRTAVARQGDKRTTMLWIIRKLA